MPRERNTTVKKACHKTKNKSFHTLTTTTINLLSLAAVILISFTTSTAEAFVTVKDPTSTSTSTTTTTTTAATVMTPNNTTIPEPTEEAVMIMEELKETVPQVKPYHFVFAYGSLICKKSRAITAPTLADKEAIPVQVQHVERIWAKRTQRGMTAMGVRFRKGAVCTGVLLPVTESELARFDKREQGYDRYQIPLDHVDEVPFLAEKDHYEKMDYEHADVVFDTNNNNDDDDNITTNSPVSNNNTNDTTEHQVFVWVYVQRYDCPADEDFPIAQSYVDIIMRGCMGISKDFARNFIETTKGWSPEEVYGEGESDDPVYDSDNEDDEEEAAAAYCQTMTEKKTKEEEDEKKEEAAATWVDDREEPIYMRADPVFSEKKADVIDQLLEDHIPEHLDNREPVAEEPVAEEDSKVDG